MHGLFAKLGFSSASYVVATRGTIVVSTPPAPSIVTYLRPDGSSIFRSDGISQYVRP